jgi:hypothetical protein
MAVTLSISRIHPKRSSATLSDLGGQIFASCRIDLTRGPPHALFCSTFRYYSGEIQFFWIVSGRLAPQRSQTGSLGVFLWCGHF